MSVDASPPPIRSCVGCRLRRAQAELVRVTKSPDGVVVADGASDGRGAWLCRSDDGESLAVEKCLESALSRRAFARAWRCTVDSDDEVAIRMRLGRLAGGDGTPDAH